MNNEAKWATFIRSSTSPRAKVVYLLLCEYMWKYGRIYVRQNTIAKQLGWSKNTVIRSLNELEQRNLITRKRLRSSCEYFVKENILQDIPRVRHISRVHSLNNTISKYTTKNTKRLPDMAYLGKRLSSGYKQKVSEIKKGTQIKKTDWNKKKKFLEALDKEDREQFWNELLEGTRKPPGGIKF